MSFNQEQGRVEYTASAAQTVFPFSFKIFANTDLKVYKTALGQTADDTTDIILLATDYTVVINGDLGGTMTLNSGATIGDSITIVRDLSITRPVEYQTNGDLLATTLNEDQEYQTYLTADQQDKNALYVTLQESSQGVSNTLPSPDALKVVGWNSQADALENFTVGDDDVFINILNIDAIADLATVNISLYSTVNIKGSTLPNDGGGGIFNYDASQSAVNDGINIINGWVRENRLVNTVDNMSELLTISTVTNQVNVKGYYTPNDGGGGIFNYDATQSAVNNGGTIINGWVRQYSGNVNVRWFGASETRTDNEVPIQSAINTGINVYISAGTYVISSTIFISRERFSIHGESRKTVIEPNGDFHAFELGTITAPFRNSNISKLEIKKNGSSRAIIVRYMISSLIEDVFIYFDKLPSVVTTESVGIEIQRGWLSALRYIKTELSAEYRAELTQESVAIKFTGDISGISSDTCLIQGAKTAFSIDADINSLKYSFVNCSHEGAQQFTSGNSTSFKIKANAVGIQSIEVNNFKGEIVDLLIDSSASTGTIYSLGVSDSFFKGEYNTEILKLKNVNGLVIFDSGNYYSQWNASLAVATYANCSIGNSASPISSYAGAFNIRVLNTLNGSASAVSLTDTAGAWLKVPLPNTINDGTGTTVGYPTIITCFMRCQRGSTPTVLKFRMSGDITNELDLSGDFGPVAGSINSVTTGVAGSVGFLEYLCDNANASIYEYNVRYGK